jgi:hypothetical protein
VTDGFEPVPISGKVVHLSRESYDVRIDRQTAWGNPFAIGRDGDRNEVIAKYIKWVITANDQPSRWIRSNVYKLYGKTLGCWCAPQECHGDFLLDLAAHDIESGAPGPDDV